MIPYQTKTRKLPGTSYSEVRKQALAVFNEIKKRTKRKPYIKSAYFNKQKVFFYVQIKEDKRSGRKYFMSCFPEK